MSDENIGLLEIHCELSFLNSEIDRMASARELLINALKDLASADQEPQFCTAQ